VQCHFTFFDRPYSSQLHYVQQYAPCSSVPHQQGAFSGYCGGVMAWMISSMCDERRLVQIRETAFVSPRPVDHSNQIMSAGKNKTYLSLRYVIIIIVLLMILIYLLQVKIHVYLTRLFMMLLTNFTSGLYQIDLV